jgi:hypothetical protein
LPDNTKRTCFVVMGFGKKTDFETGRTLDLDMSYQNMIKPAVEAAGLKCIRADEIVHSGMIEVPMYEQLLKADVVVADLSTSNKNALYELGVRHALRPHTTVVIAEDGIKVFPFDLSHVLVHKYHHLGEDIGVREANRFKEKLTEAIVEVLEKDPLDKDSPVYTILHNLKPPALDSETEKRGRSAAVRGDQMLETGASGSSSVYSILMQQVDEAQKNNDFLTAKTLLSSVREMMKVRPPRKPGEPIVEIPEDPYIIQRLALLTYKSEHPTTEKGLSEARDLLVILNPATSNDTETLGLWGAVHKRLWGLSKNNAAYLNEAIRSYERGFYLRNDYYNGINFAYLLNVRSEHSVNRAEAITDFVQAERVRLEVIGICQELLKTEQPSLDSKYWVQASLAEAYFGIGDKVRGQQAFDEALKLTVDSWMKDSTTEQLDKLKTMLANTPLKYIQTDTGRD